MIELPGDEWVICRIPTYRRAGHTYIAGSTNSNVVMVAYLVQNKRENCHLYDPFTEHIEKAEIFKSYLEANNFLNSTISTISPDFIFFVDLTPKSRYGQEK